MTVEAFGYSPDTTNCQSIATVDFIAHQFATSDSKSDKLIAFDSSAKPIHDFERHSKV